MCLNSSFFHCYCHELFLIFPKLSIVSGNRTTFFRFVFVFQQRILNQSLPTCSLIGVRAPEGFSHVMKVQSANKCTDLASYTVVASHTVVVCPDQLFARILAATTIATYMDVDIPICLLWLASTVWLATTVWLAKSA